MNERYFSRPVDLKNMKVTDAFWHREQELVRTEVIPYQWEALNDRIEDAAPSYCMHNFRVAGNMMKEKKAKGSAYTAPTYTFRGFEALPDDPKHPDDDKFYGFVFQDTDFSKWIEAVAYSLTQHPDEKLEATADEAIDIVCAAQLENGYLDTYYIINGMDRSFTNLKDHHELYCLGHLVEGAVAYYEATGKDKLLKAACRFADYVDSYFGPEEGKCKGYPGHEIAEMALVRLYQVTGEEKYLKLSSFFLNQRGTEPKYFRLEDEARAKAEGKPFKPDMSPLSYSYYQAHARVQSQDEALGHSVRAAYLYSGMADVARLTNDEEMYAACKRLWKSVTRDKMYVTGGIGATHMGEAFSFPFDLPNDTAYSETCAAIGLAFFARRMLEIEADSHYGDVLEQSLYNTVLSGMALDGKSFFYVNPLEVLPEACHKDQRKMHVKSVRQKWFGCACCPPNIARIVSSVASYAYTENEDTLWTHLYMGSEVKKTVNGDAFTLNMTSKMPWSGEAQATIKTDTPVTCTLAFRIPGWSNAAKAEITTTAEVERTQEKGYVYLTGTWKDGDSVTFNFPMPVHMVMADSRVREDIGKVAFTRGPVTYCMEEIDNGKDLHLLHVDMDRLQGKDGWNVELAVNEEMGHPMTILKVPALREEAYGQEEDSLYTEYHPVKDTPVQAVFVPYYAWNNRGEGEMSVWIRL